MRESCEGRRIKGIKFFNDFLTNYQKSEPNNTYYLLF